MLNGKFSPGISIVEILIGLVILSVVSLFIYGIFSSQLSLFVRQITGIGISSQNKIALEDITNQTRQAESIVTTCPNPPCSPGEPSTGTNAVVYRLWGLDVSGNPTNSYYDYVVIKQDGINLRRIVYKNASSSRQASDDIVATDLDPTSGLTFSYNNSTLTLANQVTVTVTTIKTESGKTQTISQSARAKIRNQPTSLPPKPAPQVTIVDPLGFTGGATSIAIGVDTFPVVAYTQSPGVKVAKCGNKECTSGNILTDLSPGDWSGGVGIAVPNDGLPVVAFYKSGDTGLGMTKCGNPACTSGNTTQSLDSTSFTGDGVSVTIGSDNLPIISYHDNANEDLKTLKCGNPDCTSGNISSLVDSGLNAGRYSSIAIGNDGLPVISYEDKTATSTFKVAKCGNAACSSPSTITTIYTAPSYMISEQTDIAIGEDGFPVVVYAEGGGGAYPHVMLTKCGNAACSSGNNTYALQNTDSVDRRYPSITIMNGLPTISYSGGVGIPDALRVRQCTNANCSAGNNLIFSYQTFPNFGYGKYSSIALGADGYPVISFGNGPDLGVAYDP